MNSDKQGRTTFLYVADTGGDMGARLLLALATCISIAVVGGWAGWAVLQSSIWSGALILVAGLSGALLLRPSFMTARLGGFFLALPALAVVAPAVAGLVRGAPEGLAWFLNGDHVRHAVYVADTWAMGSLDYAVEGYPRGWHSLMAATWSATGGGGLTAPPVTRLLQIMALSSFLLSAVLALAMAHLAHATAARAGLGPRSATAVGALVGFATLFNVFLANYQSLGYENSLLAAIVVAVCAREILVRGGSTVSLVVCSAGVVVIAHSWQLLLPVVAGLGFWCAKQAIRLRGRRAIREIAIAFIAASGFSSVSVIAVVRDVGLQHAAEVGPESPVPLLMLALGLSCALGLGLSARDATIRFAVVITALPLVLAVLLAAALGVSLLQYYPSKLLWQSALLGLPWLATVAALSLKRATKRSPRARVAVRRGAPIPVAVLGVFAMLMPWGSQLGAWSTVNATHVWASIQTPGAPRATVVWLGGSPTTDSVTRSLLDVFRVAESRARSPQARLDVNEECDLLIAVARPVVLSTEDESTVRTRYRCSPGLQIISVEPSTEGSVE